MSESNSTFRKIFFKGWHPYAFALCFPLTLYSHNQAAFPILDIIRPTIAFLLLAIFLVWLLRRTSGNKGFSELAVTATFVVFWLTGASVMAAATIVLAIVAVFVFRQKQLPTSVTPVLNALVVGVLFLPIFTLVQVELKARTLISDYISYTAFSDISEKGIVTPKPDIYHFVVDAYGGQEALLNDMGFDNTEFFDLLEARGFAVNRSNVVPYNETVHVMSGMFLGAYHVPGEFPFDDSSRTMLRAVLGAIITDSPVHHWLRNNDYNIAYSDPGHQFLRYPPNANIIRKSDGSGFNRFELHMGRVARIDQIYSAPFQVRSDNPLIASVHDAFSNDYAQIASPKFIYQHVIAPHTPFTIDRNGDETTQFPGFTNTSEGDRAVFGMEKRRKLYVDGYLEKLRFVNDRLENQIRTLQSDPAPKIIILHGDHGSGSRYVMDEPESTCIRERYSSFMAVYSNIPEVAASLEWIEQPDASPINIYRELLNPLAGTNYEPLQSRTYFVRHSTPFIIEPLDLTNWTASCDGPLG